MEWDVKELNAENFFKEINQSTYPILIDFWASWCPPCRMMHPVIQGAAEMFEGKILFRKLNTDLNKTVGGKLDVSGIPTYILFKEGKEVWRKTGALGKKQLVGILNEYLDLWNKTT